MNSRTVMYFTEKEEEFANLLIDLGTKRSVAKVLVFLANTDEATSRDIERGTDLRQPEVCLAMSDLMAQNWVSSKANKAETRGRPVKIYTLAKPLSQIMTAIEKQKKEETKRQLSLVKKLREYVD